MGVTIVKKLPKYGRNLKKKVKGVMPYVAQYLRSCADRKIRDGVPPENAPLTKEVKQGSQTLRDNGTLAASISEHSGDDWAAAGTNVKYAKINQEGGIIISKGKGLWIPAGSETRRLMRKFGATKPGQLITSMKAAGYNMWRRGGAFMASSKGGKPFVLFIVKASVKIPARPFLYITEREEKFIMDKINSAVMDSLKDDK